MTNPKDKVCAVLAQAGLALIVLSVALACCCFCHAQEQPWPAPCATGPNCWMAWNHGGNWGCVGTPNPTCLPTQNGAFEVWSGEWLCKRLERHWYTKRDGTRVLVEPRRVFWPYEGRAECFPAVGQVKTYAVLAASSAGVSNLSNPATFVGEPWTCLESPGCERPCYPGAPRRFPVFPLCP